MVSYNNDSRQRFAGSLGMQVLNCFRHTTKFNTNTDFDPDQGFTMIQPVTVPIQFADDEGAQRNIALCVTKMCLIDMTTAIIESGGIPRNFAISQFSVVDNLEQQVGLQAVLMWRGHLPHPPPGAREATAPHKPFKDHLRETRAMRLKMFWDDEEMN